ncbi:Transmembrane protein [Trema orientale]|uniref:Transmembrane protein n=1 Tax=Trema orientale TaxID=63057 RepID=A0A2P5ERS5_TREOI|nr:Transmembrane protein [Trema orientale]
MASMADRILASAREGRLSELYNILAEAPGILNHFEKAEERFKETPLHAAVQNGNVAFSMELLRLKPSLARHENEKGLLPIHIAVEQNKEHVFARFIEYDPNMVRFRGRQGLSCLLLASKLSSRGAVKSILAVSPESVEDRTARGETVFHLAVNDPEFFVFLFRTVVELLKQRDGGTAIMEQLFNRQNDNGETMIHLIVLYKTENEPDSDLESAAGNLTSISKEEDDRQRRRMLETVVELGGSYLNLKLCCTNDKNRGLNATGLATKFKLQDINEVLESCKPSSSSCLNLSRPRLQAMLSIDKEWKPLLQTFLAMTATMSFMVVSQLIFHPIESPISSGFVWLFSTLLLFGSFVGMTLLSYVPTPLTLCLAGIYLTAVFISVDSRLGWLAAVITWVGFIILSWELSPHI